MVILLCREIVVNIFMIKNVPKHILAPSASLATNFINARVRINGPKFLLYNREFQRNFPLYKKYRPPIVKFFV